MENNQASFISTFFNEASSICAQIDIQTIESIVDELCLLRKRAGRLFLLGVGGSAANCSHAVNDFRKLCNIEAYTPTDNVSELTARTNDEGWETAFEGWLKISQLNDKDTIFVMSVGGGNAEKNISMNIVNALKYAQQQNASIMGIVGRADGFTAQSSKQVLIIPTVHPDRVTPHTEAFQAVVWHCLVSHPKLQIQSTKW